MARFQKGQSGNPGGKPHAAKLDHTATIENVTKLARESSIEAIATLRKIMRDRKNSGGVRRAACSDLLDRAWGKPVTYNAEEDLQRRDIDTLTDAELQADIARLRAARSEGRGLAAPADQGKPGKVGGKLRVPPGQTPPATH